MENEKFQELVLRKLEENEQFQKNTLNQFELINKKFEENEQFQKSALKQFELINKRFEENEQFQNSVLKQMQALTQGQARLETDLKKLELKMENEVIERLRGLYDDREVRNEKLDKIEQRLTDIEVDTNYLVLKVKRLEMMAK
ncbi:MAG: hypothetical protein ACOY35_13750 [Bacillota bacterium]